MECNQLSYVITARGIIQAGGTETTTINIYNLSQAQQSIESGEIIGLEKLCSNGILNIQEIPILDSSSVLSQQDLPSPPYEPIGQWLSLSSQERERRLAQLQLQGMENFENRNLEETSSYEEVASVQSESGLDTDPEQGNQIFQVGMLSTTPNADMTNEGKNKVRSVSFSNPVSSAQSNFNFPSCTVEFLSNFPSYKTFLKQLVYSFKQIKYHT